MAPVKCSGLFHYLDQGLHHHLEYYSCFYPHHYKHAGPSLSSHVDFCAALVNRLLFHSILQLQRPLQYYRNRRVVIPKRMNRAPWEYCQMDQRRKERSSYWVHWDNPLLCIPAQSPFEQS